MTSDELISKLEAATEGARWLDEEVAVAVGWTRKDVKHDFKWKAPDDQLYILPPRYTTSLDAALTLVPDSGVKNSPWLPCIELERTWGEHRWDGEFRWEVHLSHPTLDAHVASAPTAPLALCIASLKAARHEG